MEMMRLQRELGAVLLRDPDIAGFASQTGSIGGNGNAQSANTARFFIALKPREERTLPASEIINRLRPQLARIEGANMFLQATQDITVGGRAARGSFQYTLQDANIPELVEWSEKMLDKMRTLPQLADASTDLLAIAPRLRVTINRDQASRFGITPQMIDDIIAIILLIGIVKKNGIMLVDFAITAERDDHMSPLDAIRRACLLRFRPILMTTAAAMMAGVPLALGHGTGAELRQPLGYAMVGGLALSQLLTLYTTPVVYLYLDRLQSWLKRDAAAPVHVPEDAHTAVAVVQLSARLKPGE
jgi:multidrug efflux pump subunit AcrB